MPRALKQHVIVDRWQTGGFHVERTIVCRCGWKATHYNAGYLKVIDAAKPRSSDVPVMWEEEEWWSHVDRCTDCQRFYARDGSPYVASPVRSVEWVREADAILTALAESSPLEFEFWQCVLCDAGGNYQHLKVEDHDPSCPWRRAKELQQ